MNPNFSIIWGTRQIKSQQLSLYVACAVKGLRGLSLNAGDRVAIYSESTVEYVILLLALWQLKLVAAPISPRWPEKTVIAYTAKINARLLLRSPEIKRIVCFDARQQFEANGLQALDLAQEATIIATSGSSGEAKAAVHTWGNHFYSAKGSNELIPLMASDRWLLSLPLYHVSGLALMARCVTSGAGLVILDENADVAQVMERARVTHVSLVPTQLQRLISDEKKHGLLRSLKCILIGGAAIPQGLMDSCAQLGLNIYLTYGLTEMSSQVATGRLGPDGKACVKLLPYRQLKISPEGEILVRGDVLFKGYVAGSRLDLPLQENWFATGDMGQMDVGGCLTVSGRRDNMFISGGENIHPEEIEKALLSIQGIVQAVVIPKEDKEFGQRPVAFIRYSIDPLPEDQLITALQKILPRFKVPVAFFPWPQHLIAQGLKISRQEFLKTLLRR
jgi:O-succinylbenzoic acid--CoA ligase